jgi:hypothetical protein
MDLGLNTVSSALTQTGDIPERLGGNDMEKLGGFFRRQGDQLYTGASIRIPLVDSEYGASFGEEIADLDRETAADRMGIGHFLVYRMAKDALKKWFLIDDPDTDNPDPKLDQKFQRALRVINAHEEMRKALEWERLYGMSIIVGRFNDASNQEELMKAKTANATLTEIRAYPKNKITSTDDDRDVNSDRFGEPIIYYINRGTSFNRLKVHYTRVIRVATRTGEKSVIDAIYDCLSTVRNILWALGQTIWRDGTGFPKITLNGYSVEQLTKFKDDGTFANLMSRSYILLNEDMDFEFIGAEGKALNPAPYLKPQLEDIAAGTGIPEAILRGAQAGALTGSEVNERQYWDVIATIQRDIEPVLRDLNLWALPEEDQWGYEFTWPPGIELSADDQAKTDVLIEQANLLRLEYMKTNEVRDLNNVGTHVKGGNKVPGIERLTQTSQFGTTKPAAKAPGQVTEPQGKTDTKTFIDALSALNVDYALKAKIITLIEENS